MSSLAFFLMVLHISTYSNCCLSSSFSTISRRFVMRVRVDDAILDISGLLIALATLDALCLILSVVVSLMVSMSSSSCNLSNRFLNSSWNLIFFDPIYVSSTPGGFLGIKCFPFHLYIQFYVAHSYYVVTFNVDLIDDSYVCDDRLACLLGYSQFRFSLHRLGFSMSIFSLLSSETWY